MCSHPQSHSPCSSQHWGAQMSWPKGKPCARDLSGLVFERLTVVGRAPNRKDARAYWDCKCLCGSKVIVSSSDLGTGHTKSCGCLNAEVRRTKPLKHGHNRSATYTSWRNMLARCGNPNDPRYSSYGGRGIRVCEQWADFRNFLFDMGVKPDGLSIERKDVNGNYEPGNCVWATQETQDNNKRTTVFVDLNGERISMSQAAKKLNITHGRIRWAVQKCGDNWLEFVRAAAAIGASK